MTPVDMKRTPDDKKAEAAATKARGWGNPTAASQPDYGSGLKVRLETPDLDKLGITKLPGAGHEFTLRATAKVTKVTADSGEPTGDTEGVELVITHLAMSSSGGAQKRQSTLYDKPAKAAPPAVPMPPE